MSGNVEEWVWDWYGSTYSGFTLSPDPVGASSGSSRVFRGGSWGGDASGLRSAQRSSHTPDYLNNNIGFRLARSVP
jgi:formylglycine-generating enzyme required for sulfatase activity